MFDRFGLPLNPPDRPGGHGDQGVMGLNYRNEPLRERGGDPAYWFSSWYHGDPATTRFATYQDDPLWLRVVQGSHEEQHSFQVHGLRWRRFRRNPDSTLRNQQTFGLAEAFTFIISDPFGPGDYLYKLSGADDIWLGCWGLIRSFPRAGTSAAGIEGLRPLVDEDAADGEATAATEEWTRVDASGAYPRSRSRYGGHHPSRGPGATLPRGRRAVPSRLPRPGT